MSLSFTRIASPLGPLLAAGTTEALHYLYFPQGPKAQEAWPGWVEDPAPFENVSRQLGEYFAGKRRDFDIPLAPQGTAFQRQVWAYLATIPYGETRSYGEIARHLQKPGASRAVGLANGANPLPIILPCHRVIGADGSLTGFGGGMAAKEHLLRLEGVPVKKQLSLF